MSKRQTKVRVVENNDHGDSTGRQRQLKRDEAIRNKLEKDFSKKKNSNSRTLGNKRIPGTVSALRPGQALTVKENLLVIEAAQLMAAKRCDCVLVVNDSEQLSGIFTAKDIAYRVVAENLDAKVTPVLDIMTKNPMCVTSDTSATEALNLMVSRGFRHLPVCNENGDIFGLLDVTKCLYSALEKMERAFGSSASLYDALQGVEKEWASTPAQLTQYMESLRDKMSCPNLDSVLDGTPPAEVKYKTNVRDIAIMMKQLHTTAVLVTKHHNLAGIFTSKDIVLRVIAAGLNPENCTVVRVMTPNPDTANPQTTVLDALKLMNEGHYLNLPVLDNGIVIGMVDVLKLTYVTLEQMGTMTSQDGEGGGPMWGRFWDSFGAVDIGDTASQISDHSSNRHLPNPVSNTVSTTLSSTISPQPSSSYSHLRNYSEISPNESASLINPSSVGSATNLNDTFTFKFTSAGQKTHRIVCKPTYNEVLEAVRSKVLAEHGDDVGHEEWLSLSYLDDEDDEVLISCDADVTDAVHLAVKENQTRVRLIVQDKSVAETPTVPEIKVQEPESVAAPIPIVVTAPAEIKTEKPIEPAPKQSKSKHTPPPPPKNSLLLPAAIGFLGIVVTGVIIMSKTQKNSN